MPDVRLRQRISWPKVAGFTLVAVGTTAIGAAWGYDFATTIWPGLTFSGKVAAVGAAMFFVGLSAIFISK